MESGSKRQGRGRDDGATMVEYGLLMALIALAALTAVAVFSGGVSGLFETAGNSMISVP